MTRVALFSRDADATADPVGRVNLRCIVAGPGGTFARQADPDGNPAPFSFGCDPPGSIGEDEAREVASALQRGKTEGNLRSYAWRLIVERPGSGEAPTRFLVRRAGQGSHQADRPPCAEARWERIGDSYRWVVELCGLGELIAFQERYGRLALGRDGAAASPTLDLIEGQE